MSLKDAAEIAMGKPVILKRLRHVTCPVSPAPFRCKDLAAVNRWSQYEDSPPAYEQKSWGYHSYRGIRSQSATHHSSYFLFGTIKVRHTSKKLLFRLFPLSPRLSSAPAQQVYRHTTHPLSCAFQLVANGNLGRESPYLVTCISL